MWLVWIKYFKRKQWTNRKIAFVSILIATSAAFIMVFTNIAPIAAIPSFKLAAGGLPVKLTGYIFGPIIGAVTGLLSDSISFAFRPIVWHWSYASAWILAGLVPGVVGFFMNRRWKKHNEVEEMFDKKYNVVNTIATLIIVFAIILTITLFIVFQDNSVFKDQKMIKNKWVFLGIAVSGLSSMLVAIFIFRFVLKPKMFNMILPIIVFSALLEICTTPLITIGDQSTLLSKSGTFVDNLTAHILLSPVKIWTNLIIILFAYKIVSPLIYNKSNNGWETE